MLNYFKVVLLCTGLSPLLYADFDAANSLGEVYSRYAQVDAYESWNADCNDVNRLSAQCLDNSLVRQGLLKQVALLNKVPVARVGAQKLNVKNGQLMGTAKSLLSWIDGEGSLSDTFDLVNLSSFDGQTAEFTGYYTPILSARRTPDAEYCYPIYRQPKDSRRFLSRAEIDNGGLRGSGLAFAWVNDPIDLFYLHTQGSGVLLFPGGYQKAVRFSASNEKPFRSIAQYMQQRGYLNSDLSRRAITDWLMRNPGAMGEVLAQNPRYVFFDESDHFTSASGAELIPGHSVAVDTSYIPFGSVLVAEVPKINVDGIVDGYEWRLLFPQDRGDAIRGPARMDLYTGMGETARYWANKVTGGRRAFLLLDKSHRSPGSQLASIDGY